MHLHNNRLVKIFELLKEELKKPLPGQEAQKIMLPVTRNGMQIDVPKNAKKGAVLILLYEKNSKLSICLIKRTKDGSVHSGQISFPGGKSEKSDIDLIFTALRETEEEIGTDKNKNLIVGVLTPLYIPVSNYEVLPVVALIYQEPVFKINKHEVEELIEVSVDYLLKPETRKMDKVKVNEKEYEVPVYKAGEHKIWGATAMMLSEFIYIYNKVKEQIL